MKRNKTLTKRFALMMTLMLLIGMTRAQKVTVNKADSSTSQLINLSSV